MFLERWALAQCGVSRREKYEKGSSGDIAVLNIFGVRV